MFLPVVKTQVDSLVLLIKMNFNILLFNTTFRKVVTILLFLMVPAHKIYKKYLMVRKANVANVSSQQRGTCNFMATVDKWWHSVALKVG